MAAHTTTVAARSSDLIERLFHVREAGSTIATEVRGGATNYLVMSYILVVNAGLPATSVTGPRRGRSLPWRPHSRSAIG